MDTIENFNETKLKRALINFEKKFNDNQKLRIKYAEDPAKFAGSETELFAALDELQGLSTQPELYHILISKNALCILTSLLSHENTDISGKVVGMLQEFTDIDETEDQKSTEALINALVKDNIVDLVVSNLYRLDENIKEESQTIINSLAIIDNLIDFDSKIVSNSSESLVDWMINQLKKKLEFDSMKLSIAELLSVLLMETSESKKHLGEIGGIDVLLQQVAYYRRVAPVTGDEHEFLEQTINCLCTAVLACDENRESFFKEEGVDLVELILREKRDVVRKSNIKASTLKLFNHVLTTEKNRDPIVTKCCERFVKVLGLRVLFPIFNNPKLILNEKVKKREYHQVLDEIEEHASAIILSLLKYCQDTELLQRVLVKFAESNFEKLNRLLALHDKYFKLVKMQQEEATSSDSNDEDDKTRSSAYYTLRTVDYILLLACYLTDHFETYDPNSGETFTNRMSNLLALRPELYHQISMETKKHLNEVENIEESNSLELLLKHFEQFAGSSLNTNNNKAPPNSHCQ